ncbi:hypothetical protein MALH05_00663 [Mycoplasma anatis]|nr:hypothetical protein [Mycoplasmopsis anatis]
MVKLVLIHSLTWSINWLSCWCNSFKLLLAISASSLSFFACSRAANISSLAFLMSSRVALGLLRTSLTLFWTFVKFSIILSYLFEESCLSSSKNGSSCSSLICLSSSLALFISLAWSYCSCFCSIKLFEALTKFSKASLVISTFQFSLLSKLAATLASANNLSHCFCSSAVKESIFPWLIKSFNNWSWSNFSLYNFSISTKFDNSLVMLTTLVISLEIALSLSTKLSITLLIFSFSSLNLSIKGVYFDKAGLPNELMKFLLFSIASLRSTKALSNWILINSASLTSKSALISSICSLDNNSTSLYLLNDCSIEEIKFSNFWLTEAYLVLSLIKLRYSTTLFFNSLYFWSNNLSSSFLEFKISFNLSLTSFLTFSSSSTVKLALLSNASWTCFLSSSNWAIKSASFSLSNLEIKSSIEFIKSLRSLITASLSLSTLGVSGFGFSGVGVIGSSAGLVPLLFLVATQAETPIIGISATATTELIIKAFFFLFIFAIIYLFFYYFY